MRNYIQNTIAISEKYKEGSYFIVKYYSHSLKMDNEKAFKSEFEADQFIKTL